MLNPVALDPHWTLTSALDAQRNGTLTAVELLESCLQRIADFDDALCAWVSVDLEGAREQAQLADTARAAGRWLGPLHGIPVGVKDIYDVRGWPTRLGLADDAPIPAAREDSAAVHCLREAGAVVLGKTVTTLFACFDPPPTVNPHNAAHTPGGSSSGSAVAVATGMCLAALGSQTGGSIHRPAAYCGIAGCKPSFGRIPRTGVFPVSASLDHVGPMCRNVSDLSIMLSVLCNAEYAQPEPNPLDGERGFPEIVATEQLRELAHEPRHVGLLEGAFRERADGDAYALLQSALQKSTSPTLALESADLPFDMDTILTAHRALMVYEMARVHQQHRQWETWWQPGARSLIEEGLALSEADWQAAHEIQLKSRRDIDACWESEWAHLSAVVSLAAPGPAPDTSTTGSPVFNAPWSFLGLPTVSFPIASHPNGMPLSMQLIGRRGEDSRLLSLAAECEHNLFGT